MCPSKYFFCFPSHSHATLAPALLHQFHLFCLNPHQTAQCQKKQPKKGKTREQYRLYPFFQPNANFKKYSDTNNYSIDENMIPEVELRTQGSRPRTKDTDASDSKSVLEAKDVLEDSTSARYCKIL